MKNYKMLIEYDGSRYYGWQRQPGRETIQGKLEKVLSLMCQAEVEVIGAGRTDAGVHARGMVANACMDTELPEEEIRAYLNRYLPDDIAVKEVREASPRFHARYNAVGKTYCYTCCDGEVKSVFDRKYVTRLEEKPDLEKMLQAADLLKGEHDFRNFCANNGALCGPDRNYPQGKLYHFYVSRKRLFTEYGAYYGGDSAGSGLRQDDL